MAAKHPTKDLTASASSKAPSYAWGPRRQNAKDVLFGMAIYGCLFWAVSPMTQEPSCKLSKSLKVWKCPKPHWGPKHYIDVAIDQGTLWAQLGSQTMDAWWILEWSRQMVPASYWLLFRSKGVLRRFKNRRALRILLKLWAVRLFPRRQFAFP